MLKQFGEEANGLMRMQVDVKDAAAGQAAAPAQLSRDSRTPTDVRIVDANGKLVNGYRVIGTLPAEFSAVAVQAAARPLKAVLITPATNKKVRFPIEIRDVILP
jgi:hypothetical protein